MLKATAMKYPLVLEFDKMGTEMQDPLLQSALLVRKKQDPSILLACASSAIELGSSGECPDQH